MRKAVAYARYSSSNQQGESIEAQLRAIQAYADQEDISILQIYIDEAETATSVENRSSFLRMIAELKHLKPDLVLTHKMDRFARNRYDSAIYKREIQKAGARYIAVDQPISDSPEGIILEALLEGIAEYYSANLSKEVSIKMLEYARKGLHLGGIPPLGYEVDADKHYIINEAEADTVRMIFKMRLDGSSYSAIIDRLNALGRRTKTGRSFGKNSLHDILRNEKYTGVYIFNSTPGKVNGKRNNRKKRPLEEQIRIEGAMPVIIDKESFRAVQALMDENRYNARRVIGSDYILTGVLRCGYCNGAMTGHTLSKTNAAGERMRYRYYRCTQAQNKPRECGHKTRYPAEDLEEKVYRAIENKASQIKDIKAFAAQLWEEIQKANRDQDRDLTVIQKQLAEVEKRLENYYKAIESGAELEHLIRPLNEAGRLKKELEARLAHQVLPFGGISKKDVLDYLKSQRGIKIPRHDAETSKTIVRHHVEDVIVWSKEDLHIKLKYQLPKGTAGMPEAGGGGGTPAQTYYLIVS